MSMALCVVSCIAVTRSGIGASKVWVDAFQARGYITNQSVISHAHSQNIL
jgi:hypothetical protein